MSSEEQSRLDRLENIAESNARAIQALANEWQKDREQWQKDREQWQKDRTRLYDAMSRVAAAQATFWEIQGDYYRRLEEMDRRQAQIIEILDRVTSRDSNS